MTNNFDIRQFLTENKLTKNSKLINEVSDYGFDALMDEVDDLYSPGTPEHIALSNAVEEAMYNGEIDMSESEESFSQAVDRIAGEIGLEENQLAIEFQGDKEAKEMESELDLGHQYTFDKDEQNRGSIYKEHGVYFVKGFENGNHFDESFDNFENAKDFYLGKKEGETSNFEEETYKEKEDMNETKLTAREKLLVEMVQDALNPIGRTDRPLQMFAPKGVEESEMSEETVEEAPSIPKYNSIEELMKEIENGTNKAGHEYKMNKMKEVCEALENKVTSLEEGENAEHIDQKKVKQMRKDIAALRKAEEKLRKEFDKKFSSKEKKETPKIEKEEPVLAEGFDLRKYLIENRKK